MKNCYKCGTPLIRKEEASSEILNQKKYASEEHIIPNFCGGMLTSWELLCEQCNNQLGTELDSELSDQLLFHKLIPLKLDRGTQPDGHIIAYTRETKTPILINKKWEWKHFKPTITYTPDGVVQSFTARNKKEAKKILEGLKRKFPKLDVEKSMSSLEQREEFLQEKIDFSGSDLGGYKMHRAIAKIAVSFYFHTGGNMSFVRDVVEYVCKSGIKNKYVTFYYSFFPIHNLGEKEISHLLFLRGDKIKKLLYCYIELFSTANFIVILNNDYEGESFQTTYCYDVINSIEIKNKSVKLKLFQDPFEWLKYQVELDKHIEETDEYMVSKASRTFNILEEMAMDSIRKEQNFFIIKPEDCTQTELKSFESLVLEA